MKNYKGVNYYCKEYQPFNNNLYFYIVVDKNGKEYGNFISEHAVKLFITKNLELLKK